MARILQKTVKTLEMVYLIQAEHYEKTVDGLDQNTLFHE